MLPKLTGIILCLLTLGLTAGADAFDRPELQAKLVQIVRPGNHRRVPCASIAAQHPVTGLATGVIRSARIPTLRGAKLRRDGGHFSARGPDRAAQLWANAISELRARK